MLNLFIAALMASLTELKRPRSTRSSRNLYCSCVILPGALTKPLSSLMNFRLIRVLDGYLTVTSACDLQVSQSVSLTPYLTGNAPFCVTNRLIL